MIVGVGRAGNPDVVDNPDLLIGSNTAPVYGQGYIATPGGIDTHVHLVQPRLIPAALAAGMTTLITGGLNENPAFNLRADVPRLRAPAGQPGHAGPGGQLHGRPARAPDRVGRVRAQGARGLRGVSEHHRPGAHRRRRLTTSRSRCTPTASTSRASSTRRWRRSPGGAIHAYHVEGIGGGPRPGHPGDRRRRPRHRLVHDADHSLRPQRRRRAPRHDVVGARHEPARAERPGDDRRPHPRLHHARGERAARPGGDQHHQLRLPGHGADRRSRSGAPGSSRTR